MVKSSKTAVKNCVVCFSPFDRDKTHERLRSILYNSPWRLLGTFDDPQECFLAIESGRASILILDDFASYPAEISLMQQQFFPASALSPTVVLSGEGRMKESRVWQSLGMPHVLEKPISPERLLVSLKQLDLAWGRPALHQLRQVAMLLAAGKQEDGVRLIDRLLEEESPHFLSYTVKAFFYRKDGELSLCEELLQRAIQQGHKELSIALPLVDLYLNGSSPLKALKILNMIDAEYLKPSIATLPSIQAHLMLHQLVDCESFLLRMIEDNYFASAARNLLPRLAYSTGNSDLFDRSINYNSSKFNTFQKAWHHLSEDEAKKRLEAYEKMAETKKKEASEKREQAGYQLSPSTYLYGNEDEGLKGYGDVGQPMFEFAVQTIESCYRKDLGKA